MHQLFYILALILLVFWVLSFTVWQLGNMGHFILLAAVVFMTIGLFRRSARH